MRLVGFGSNRSRSVSIGDEFLKVFDDFGEETGDESAGQAKATGEHLGQEAAQVREGQGAIDTPRRIWGNEVLGRQISGQRIEVVADHLGADILTGREPGQAGRMLKRQAMLEALERLLDAPAAMIKLGEGERADVRAHGARQGFRNRAARR